MKLLLITEGSEKHGLGHLNRVKSFIYSNKDSKHEIIAFAFINDSLQPLFTEVIDNLRFPSNNEEVFDFASQFNPDFVIFDLLKLDKTIFSYFKEKNYKLVSFSPIFNFLDQVDYLFTRGSLETPPNVKVFSGTEYIIIGNHVEKINNKQFQSNLNSDQLPIAIAMGGTDAPNKTLKILEALKVYQKSLLIWVLLGEGYRHSYTQLVHEIKENSLHEIILARTNRSMWKILKNAVISISAGGLTAYEAAYAGLPSITIVEKESHLALLESLFINNCAIDGGVFENFEPKKMLEKIEILYENRNSIFQMRQNSKDIMGLNGPKNIIRVLEKILK